ncbi:hypothetical protein E2C01_029784 [Portunus trituberculatus]|uniref:Uncharacterized protein n=1 Tax=Portunus trituberculatus TaxID=210409 RepID=A0A5B7ETC4_PORTR|nr:hypothetical protein [Portunus trituberculatus]
MECLCNIRSDSDCDSYSQTLLCFTSTISKDFIQIYTCFKIVSQERNTGGGGHFYQTAVRGSQLEEGLPAHEAKFAG